MNKFYLVIFLIILITVGVIALWNLIINAEEKRAENRMYEAKRKNPGGTICNYCKLYADSEYGYCFYAGECTEFQNRCHYFIEKKGGAE